MNADNPSPVHARRRYSPWAMGAMVCALLALLLQGVLVPLNLAVAIMALIGLRQIRREPSRYIGRAFCWLAIALVLILAVLTAMVEPTAPQPPAQQMVPDTEQSMPDDKPMAPDRGVGGG
ncbi:hypothetical protein ACR80S_06050 [Halomonas sp. MA07-2]|uniref:hypothetical protein n=1 Tax=unclassified Halomonas TaxID=2609666 RepID=UPI003EF01DCD